MIDMKEILIIGGGAAGMMAAIAAAEHGAQVTILEKMPTLGRKLLITGKGRCNITNSCDVAGFIRNMPGNGSFLYSALHTFDNRDMIAFMEQCGVPTKVERGGRVFPVSDKAADVVTALQRALYQRQIKVWTGQAVKRLTVRGGTICGLITGANQEFPAEAVVLATGGSSYPATGSTGDGYLLAKQAGHTIVPLRPSLVPLEVEEDWVQELQGLSLKNVRVTILAKGSAADSEFGEMLFTHYGLSGPVILSLSDKVSALLLAKKDLRDAVILEINLKPALTADVLDLRLQRDFEKFIRKQVKNALYELLPTKLIDVIIDIAHIDPEKPVHQITKSERQRLVHELQHLSFTIRGTRPLSEAVVTAGGVSTKEINAKTMQSKLVGNLFFAGEVIDINGYTGGYNLQAAFSTGYTAGLHAAE
jgi:predicted Rossmann fold flavoprotein